MLTNQRVLAAGTHRTKDKDVFLVEVSPGQELAGSRTIHTNGYYVVRWNVFDDGRPGHTGQRFQDYEQARDWFERVTA